MKSRADISRENGRKSKGPKNTSLVKFNALKHGLRAEAILLPGESVEEFQELRERLIDDLKPQGALEAYLVDTAAALMWRLRRAVVVERDYLCLSRERCFPGPGVNLPWGRVVVQELGRGHAWLNLSKYETALFNRLFRTLEQLRRTRDVETIDV